VSKENVDKVLSGYEALNRGDFDWVAERLHPDVVWKVVPFLPDPGPFHGPEGVRGFLETWSDAFDEFQIVPEEAIDAGDRVMVMALVRGRGKDSGGLVETPSFAHIWTFRDGMVVDMEMFPNRAEGLAELGMDR
jgi:ketosteroid isomerase-like protein